MRRRSTPLAVSAVDAIGIPRADVWRRIVAASLPFLAIGALLVLSACGSMSGPRGAASTPPGAVTGTMPEQVPSPAPDVIAGNLWSPQMEQRREALVRAGAPTGVAVARTADNQLKLTVPADASFDVGRSELKPALRPVLDEVARQLEDSVRVTIVGHTDSSAGDAVNGPLSLDRAESVREYLVHHGVRRGRLLEEGRGGRQPVASNATEAGRAANRRIEIFLSQPAS